MYEPRGSISLDGGDCKCQATTSRVTTGAGHSGSRHLSLLNNVGSDAEVPIAQVHVLSPTPAFHFVTRASGAIVGVRTLQASCSAITLPP